MPIDFPANPTNGQVYGNWIYDSSITSWRNVNTDTGIGTLNAMGLKNVVPASVVVGSGSATTNSNGTVSFSSATSISLNGVFTSTYSNYRIAVKLVGQSGSGILQMRLRSSGTDFSGSNYHFGGWYGRTNSVGAFNGGSSNSSALLIDYVVMTDWTLATTLDIFDPFATDQTTWLNQGWNYDGTGPYASSRSGMLYNTNSYDGVSFLPSGTGALSGTIQVYGYTN